MIKVECTFRHSEPLPFEEPEEREGFLVRNCTEFLRELACRVVEPDDTDDLPNMDRPLVFVSLENESGKANAAPVMYSLLLTVLIPGSDWTFMDDTANSLNLAALVLQKLDQEILFFSHRQRFLADEEKRTKKLGDTKRISFKEFVDRVNSAETTDGDDGPRKDER